MKSLVLREKEEKVASEFSDDEAWALIQSILDAGKSLLSHVQVLVGKSPSKSKEWPFIP